MHTEALFRCPGPFRSNDRGTKAVLFYRLRSGRFPRHSNCRPWPRVDCCHAQAPLRCRQLRPPAPRRERDGETSIRACAILPLWHRGHHCFLVERLGSAVNAFRLGVTKVTGPASAAFRGSSRTPLSRRVQDEVASFDAALGAGAHWMRRPACDGAARNPTPFARRRRGD